MTRSWQTIDHSENARTGPSALGSRLAAPCALHERRRRPGRLSAPAKFFVVDLITEHEVETHQELAGESDPGLRPPAAVQDREVAAPQIVVRPGGKRSGLAQDPAQERVALLRNRPESVFVSRSIDGGSQADVAYDMLAVRKARHRPQDEHGCQGCEWTDARMGEPPPGARVRGDDGGDPLIELVDSLRQPGEQIETVIATTPGVRRQGQGVQSGEPMLGPQLRAERQALIETVLMTSMTQWVALQPIRSTGEAD